MHPLPSKSRDHCQREVRKTGEPAAAEIEPYLPGIARLLYTASDCHCMHKIFTRSSQPKYQHGWESSWSPAPYTWNSRNFLVFSSFFLHYDSMSWGATHGRKHFCSLTVWSNWHHRTTGAKDRDSVQDLLWEQKGPLVSLLNANRHLLPRSKVTVQNLRPYPCLLTNNQHFRSLRKTWTAQWHSLTDLHRTRGAHHHCILGSCSWVNRYRGLSNVLLVNLKWFTQSTLWDVVQSVRRAGWQFLQASYGVLEGSDREGQGKGRSKFKRSQMRVQKGKEFKFINSLQSPS